MKKKVKINFSNIFVILFVIASIYFIHAILLLDHIENILRYIVIGLIIVIDLLIIAKTFFGKRKNKKRYVFSTLLIIFTALLIFIGYNINEIYTYFSKFNKNVFYSISLVTLKENNEVSLNNLKDAKIGVKKDEDQSLYKDIVDKYSFDKNNELVEYEDYRKMILDLYDGKVDFIFLQTNFVDVYSANEEFEDIGEKLVVVDTVQKEVSKEEGKLSGSSKDISEPLTILLMGIDSTANGLQNADSFNGDSLMVVTFNPTTMSATMLSIPRDSYVPISCMGNVDNKITHSAQNGTRCVINTIQNFLDIEIDYYVKINFLGVVDLVDAVGGIEVDVPFNMCEQDSQRRFGDHTIYIKQGHRKLNGEKALAFARNRKSNSEYCSKKWTQGERSDFVRADNQQAVVQAILKKLKNIRSLDDVKKILSVVSKNIDTNMTESTMFSFYNVAKDVYISSSSEEVISFQKLYLDGTGQMIYDERSGLVLWDYILNTDSLNAVKKAMKDNLSGTKQSLIKTFSYSYGENYEATVIGKGYYGTDLYPLVPDLVGMKLTDANAWATNNGIKLNVQYVKVPGRSDGVITYQDAPEKKRIDLITNKTITVKVVQNNSSTPSSTKVDCLVDTTNSVCILPNFVGKSRNDVDVWANKFSNIVTLHYSYEESDQSPGIVIRQDVASGTSVKDILNGKMTINITLTKEKSTNNSDSQEGSSGNSGSSSDEGSDLQGNDSSS